MRPLRSEMQIIFQDPYGSLNPRMTVGQIVSEGLRIHGMRDRGGGQRPDRRAARDRSGFAPEAADRYPHEFSGGQRQRDRDRAGPDRRARLIVCDEPVSALDVSIQAQILNLLKDLQEQLGLSYLFISHDLNVVGYLSDRVAVMYLGQIMESAPADELFDRPLHPYTHVLLASAPDLENGRRPDAAPPEPPSETAEADGAVPVPAEVRARGRGLPHVRRRARAGRRGSLSCAAGGPGPLKIGLGIALPGSKFGMGSSRSVGISLVEAASGRGPRG